MAIANAGSYNMNIDGLWIYNHITSYKIKSYED